MSPIAVAGMHRSGTSMVARTLNLLGLHLGDEAELVAPTSENPDGYWEHAGFVDLNEELLHEFGGGWDKPVPFPADWEKRHRVCGFRARAGRLIEQFNESDPWGWKDPRTSLTLPFWQQLIPDMSVVLCVRHPLEVALSLKRRGMFSYTLALDLWRTYNESVTRSVEPERLVVTHYDSFFRDPQRELRRLATFLGLPADRDVVARAVASIKEDNRHSHLSEKQLREAGVARDIRALYRRLCRLSDGDDPRGGGAAEDSESVSFETVGERRIDRSAFESERLRLEVIAVRGESERRQTQIRNLEQQVADARVRNRTLEAARDSLQEALAAGEDQAARLEETLDRFERRMQERINRLASELQNTFDGLQETMKFVTQQQYAVMVSSVRQVVQAHIPRDALLLVASRGDDDLLRLDGRRAQHFPGTDDGAYAGHHPDGLTAISELETMRARGAEYFVVPATTRWWLEHYDDLREYLDSTADRVVDDPATCTVFSFKRAEVPR